MQLSYKQCLKVLFDLFPAEEAAPRAFVVNTETAFQEASSSLIPVSVFMAACVEAQPQQLLQSTHLSPFHSTEAIVRPEESFGDSGIPLDTVESESLKSVELPPATPSVASITSSRVSAKRSPFEEVKAACLAYAETTLASQFVGVLLNTYGSPFARLQQPLEQWLQNTLRQLIEAVCDCDRRRWLSLLQSEDKEDLRFAEGLQKEFREWTRKGYSPEDVEQVTKSFLRIPKVKLQIEQQVSRLFQQS